MRKILVGSAMALLALGMEAVGAGAVPFPDAARFNEYDIQAPLAPTRSEVREIQALHEAGDNVQALGLEDTVQTP